MTAGRSEGVWRGALPRNLPPRSGRGSQCGYEFYRGNLPPRSGRGSLPPRSGRGSLLSRSDPRSLSGCVRLDSYQGLCWLGEALSGPGSAGAVSAASGPGSAAAAGAVLALRAGSGSGAGLAASP